MQNKNSRPQMFRKKAVLRNFAKFTGKHLCQNLFFNKFAGKRPEAYDFIKKESLAQVLSCELCEISKNIFSYRTPLLDDYYKSHSKLLLQIGSIDTRRKFFKICLSSF